MGANFVKLIDEDSSMESFRMDFDLEQGENEESESWDSDASSVGDDSDETSDCEYRITPVYPDPYIVEKRFVAGSTQYYYDIKKRK